jgi:hypothetical protein
MTVPAWPVQGEWTYEDYLRLPDDGRRYEVIRGRLYVTPAPNFDHQFLVTQLGRLLGNFVAAHALGTVLVAPFDHASSKSFLDRGHLNGRLGEGTRTLRTKCHPHEPKELHA